MLVGRGLLATAFGEFSDNDHVVIFASGVSNSREEDPNEFLREERLIRKTIAENRDKLFVYFSSCALANEASQEVPYYRHKRSMETLIKRESDAYLILRLPQVFGDIKEATTLINYLYNNIVQDREFCVWSKAYRYIIHTDDVLTLVKALLHSKRKNETVDLANPYRYHILELIGCIENKIGRHARYSILEREDQYELDLNVMKKVMEENGLSLDFGNDYFCKKLKTYEA